MKLWALPCFIGILAIFSGNIVFLIAVKEGFLSPCIPYLEGCASISKSGREGLAFILFKLTIMPLMTLLSVYWVISFNFFSKRYSLVSKKNRFLLFSGILGSLFGILYACFLGSVGETYQLLRRFGIYFFFMGTYCAQISEVLMLFDIKSLKNLLLLRAMKYLVFIVGFVILFSTPFYGFIEEDDWLENILEWNITFLIFFYFILSSFLWKRIDIRFKATSNYLERGSP